MSYVSQGEKVFGFRDASHPDCTPPKVKRSDHRLKSFYSTFDRRAWDFCDEQRYRHLYELVSGSQTCLITDECHRYVPLEDLIKILLAEKEAYIKELEERLRKCCGDQWDENSKSEGKKNMADEVASLTQELSNSREMLRQAMHKLQNIDEIVNENKKLHCRLRCSEERVKYLEEKKKRLECELADLRSKSQIQIDLEKAQEMLVRASRREDATKVDGTTLENSFSDREELREKVARLEKELEESKKKENELEKLKSQSRSSDFDMEEITRENECYKKKLASMKCLEKQIQELKKQGRALADKHKREAQKAAEQMRKMCQAGKELQCLRDERDSLRKRVDELSSFECQYKALQRKLKCVDKVIAENDALHSKLVALDELEKENEYLRCRLNQIQEMEMSAAEDKERIAQLQCAVADQEEEMKNLLCQIKKLTSGQIEEELQRLKCELFDKNSKLKLCEQQLAEIPMLEAEIDELRVKLQSCCREFSEKKTYESKGQKIEIRLPTASKEICAKYKNEEQKSASVLARRQEERVGLEKSESSYREISVGHAASPCSETMSCDEVQSLLQSSKEIITCVLEDMIEHQKEMEELEKCNREMKGEIQSLKNKVGNSDKDDLVLEIDRCKKTLEEKNAEIRLLQQGIPSSSGSDEELERLKELNREMKSELEAACVGLKEIANLEQLLRLEHEARCRAENLLARSGIRDFSPSLSPAAGSPSSPGAVNIPKSPVRAGSPGSPSSLPAAISPSFPPAVDTTGSPTPAGSPGSPAPAGFPSSPAPAGSPGSPAPVGSPGLPTPAGSPGSPAPAGFPGSPAPAGFPGSPAPAGSPGSPPFSTAGGSSSFPAAVNISGTPATAGSPGLPLSGGSPASPLSAGKRSDGLEKDLDFDSSKALQKETEDLKLQILELNKLTNELKKENELLRELQQPCPDFSKELDEKCALENLLSLLQAELDAFKGQKLSDECEALRNELKRIMEQNCQLKALVDCYRQRLDLEKKSNLLAQSEGKKTELDAKPALPETVGEIKKEPKKLASTEFQKEEGRGKAFAEDFSEKKDKQKAGEEVTEKKEGTKEEKVPENMEEEAQKNIEEKIGEIKGEKKEDIKQEIKQEIKEEVKDEVRKDKKDEKKEGIKKEDIKKEDIKKEVKDEDKKVSTIESEKATIKNENAKTIPEDSSGKKYTSGPDSNADAGEIERLKKLLEEKEAALNDQKQKCDEVINSLKADNAKLVADKNELQNSLKEARGGQPEQEDALKRLKELENEKRDTEKKLVSGSATGGDDCEQRLKQMEMENAEKLKKIMEQHEKELGEREKAYNDNLNAMKSGYETDIRKMADRHKQSILRLQGLHEDEVQELNTNYETQMETMQTQSEEAINHVAKGSAAKLRKLSQQHDEQLKSAEANHAKEVTALQKTLSSLAEKHDREIKNMRKSSVKRLSLMKNKYEGLIEEERKKSDSQLEALEKKLKEKAHGDGVCDCNTRKKKDRKPRDPTCPLDFYEVLEKILEQGLDSLTFNEIALVHRKTCCALEGIVMNSDVVPTLEPPVGDGCAHSPLLQADKQQLLNRIVALEREIATKQRQTQETIVNMEMAVKKERCRLLELKNVLQNEQQKNSELKSLLTSQTKMQSDLKRERDVLGDQASIHQSSCLEKSKQLDQEKKDKKYLEDEIDRLKSKVNQLCSALNAERGNAECKQKKEVEQIQMMRQKLERSATQEHRLAVQLENEAKYRMQLQCQLQALKTSFKQMVNLPPVEKDIKPSQNPFESKSAKEKQNFDQVNKKKSKIKPKLVKKHR